jgi:hypothetical protein
MKHLFIASVFLLSLFSCKNNESAPATQAADGQVEKEDVSKQSVENGKQEIELPSVDGEEKIDVTSSKSEDVEVSYASFGAKIKADKALSKDQMLTKYKALKKGDTLKVKFTSTIKAVCKKKGCWMEMELPNNQVSFVRFKDYGFFVPLNADKSEAVVSGRAYIDVISVEERRHYAKDEGKSEEEIAKITEPKITYAFQADGVLIKE